MDLLDIFGGSIVKEISGVAKEYINKDTKALELNNEKEKVTKQYDLDTLKVKEQNVTDRWKFDLLNGTWLSKTIRPLTLVYWTIAVSIIIFFDGNIGYTDASGIWHGMTIKDIYVPYIFNIYGTILGGYFILRTVEKHNKVTLEGHK